MQKIIIDNLIVPSHEVIARVVSNPSIKIATETNWWQIGAMILAPLLAAFVTYWLTIKVFKNNEDYKKEIQKSNIELALKYEIFNNVYQIVDMKRVAEKTREIMANTNKMSALIYIEVGYVAFNSMIQNNLISCADQDAERLFQLYSLLREYDLAIKRLIADIENAPKTCNDAEIYRGAISKNMEKIVNWAAALEEKCERLFKNISFLNLDEWGKFKKAYQELNQ